MTERPDNHTPRWALKEDKAATSGQEVRVKYRFLGGIVLGVITWAVVKMIYTQLVG